MGWIKGGGRRGRGEDRIIGRRSGGWRYLEQTNKPAFQTTIKKTRKSKNRYFKKNLEQNKTRGIFPSTS